MIPRNKCAAKSFSVEWTVAAATGLQGSPAAPLTACKPVLKTPGITQIFVFFPDDEKLGVERITKYMERMKEESVSRAILVLQRPLSAKGKSQLAMSVHKVHIQDVRPPFVPAGDHSYGLGTH